jgi:hypothetical protein
MEIAFDLAEAAEQMKRLSLKRQNPDATEEETEQAIREWYSYRPGAEHGDGEGVPAPPETWKRILGTEGD